MKHSRRNRVRNGFTLVELMVVLVIISVLAGVVTQQVLSYVYKSKVTAVRAQIRIFEDAIDKYKMDTGQYPDESLGLFALVEQPPGVTGWDTNGYLKGGILPKDPWKNEYVYELTNDPQRPYEIYSLGADGKEGGEGENADIFAFDMEDLGNTQSQ